MQCDATVEWPWTICKSVTTIFGCCIDNHRISTHILLLWVTILILYCKAHAFNWWIDVTFYLRENTYLRYIIVSLNILYEMYMSTTTCESLLLLICTYQAAYTFVVPLLSANKSFFSNVHGHDHRHGLFLLPFRDRVLFLTTYVLMSLPSHLADGRLTVTYPSGTIFLWHRAWCYFPCFNEYWWNGSTRAPIVWRRSGRFV